MRLVFGMLSLLVLLAVVGLLVKKQPGALTASEKPAPASHVTAKPDASTSTKNSQLQSQRIQEQVRLSVEAAMQRPRTADGE